MTLAPKPPDAPPTRIVWRCPACRYPRNLAHWLNCAECGEARP